MSIVKPLVLSCLLLLISITNLASAQTSYTQIKQMSCNEKPSEFYLFYDGESIPPNYEKIGEVSSTQELTGFRNNDLLSNIKYTAWSNCANGLLFIKSGFSGVEGLKYYNAIAVRFETDSDFKLKYGTGSDMAFVQKTENRAIELKKKRKGFGILYLTGILVFAYILFS